MKKITLIILLLHTFVNMYGIDRYSNLFQNNLSELNPATIATEENNRATLLTTIHRNRDSKIYNLFTTNLSVGLPITKLNSGIGLHSSYHNFSSFDDWDIGIIYSYRCNLNEDISISAGSDFSLISDDFDGTPFSSSSGKKRIYLFNMDIGIWFNLYGFQIGVSNKHINEPTKELYSKINIHDDNNYYKSLENFDKLYYNFDYTVINSLNLIFKYDYRIYYDLIWSNSLLIYDLNDFSEEKYSKLNSQFLIDKKLTLGFTLDLNYQYYETSFSFSPNFGLVLFNKLNAIISYDLIRINPRFKKDYTLDFALSLSF